MPGIEGHGAQGESASVARKSGQERGQEHDRADIGDQKFEGALGCPGIESRCGGAKAIGGDKEIAKRFDHLDRSWGKLHCLAITNHQGIAEMRPKPRQNFAYGGLRRVEQLRCARQIALPQDNAQRPEVVQPEIGIIPKWHDHHSCSDIGPITAQR